MKYSKLREEELESRVAQDFFGKFDHAKIIKDIDFAVKIKHNSSSQSEYFFGRRQKRLKQICLTCSLSSF